MLAKKEKKVKKTSSTAKQIAVREVKKSTAGARTIDLRVKAKPVENEVVEKIEPKKVTPAKPSVEKHEEKKHVQVREYDLDEKIDFKHVSGKPANLYRKISVTFIALTGLLLVAMAYFSFVKVDISVVLNKQLVKGSAVIDVINEGQAATGTSAVIGVIKQVDLQQSKEFPVTGKIALGVDVNGKVRIVNNYVRNQPLVASTRLLTSDNQLVHVKNTVNVPAGGSVEVEVYSTEASSTVNIASGTRLTIPGLWQGIQDKIYAESLSTISYQEKSKKVVSAEDIKLAETSMLSELENKVKNDVVPLYKAQYSQVVYKIDENTFSVDVDAKPQQEKELISAQGRVKVVIIAFNSADIQKRAQDQLVAQLPANKSLVKFDESALTYELGTYDVNAGTASVNVNYSGAVLGKDQSVIDKSKLVDLTAAQLENYLKGLSDVGSYQIKFTPAFVGRVPSWIDRINVTVQEQ